MADSLKRTSPRPAVADGDRRPASENGKAAKSPLVGGFFHQHPQAAYIIATVLTAGFFFICFGWPLLRIFVRAFFDPHFTLRHFREILLDPSGHYLRVFITTFRVAGTVTLLCLLLGYPVAVTMLRAGPQVRRFIMICVLLPFWTSVLVRTYAWMVLLGRNGLINDLLTSTGIIDAPLQLIFNTTGTVIGMTHIMLPYMIFPLYSVMQNIDPRMMTAAYVLGATPRRAFFRIFFPLSLPGVLGGCLVVFVISLGFFITPALMGGQQELMVAVLIERQVMRTLEWGLSAALSIVLLVSALLVTLLMRRFLTGGTPLGVFQP
jgi:ABC-type spermidine/putrescine transport system permease subunit I